jgi:ATP-dependent protease ClpP protease subunit
LAATTGLDDERLVAELERGRFLTAAEARELRIVDAVDDPASNPRSG